MTWFQLRRRLRRASIPVVIRVWPLARLWYRGWGLSLDGRPDDQVWYFAYGANINEMVFRERRGVSPSECRVGRLCGYRLRFNLDGRPRGRSAPANISIDPDGEVWGVLYRITRRDLVRLNASEGIPGRRYQPILVDVEDADRQRRSAVTYIADGKEDDGKPSLRYISLIREGAHNQGLPRHWVSMLGAVEHAESGDAAQYPDRNRRQRNSKA